MFFSQDVSQSGATSLSLDKSCVGFPIVAERCRLRENSLGFAKGFLAHDPDGHGLQFIER